jgi:hypothetical protein
MVWRDSIEQLVIKYLKVVPVSLKRLNVYFYQQPNFLKIERFPSTRWVLIKPIISVVNFNIEGVIDAFVSNFRSE